MNSLKIAGLSLALCVSWPAFTSVGAQEGTDEPLPEGEVAQPTEPAQPLSPDASRPFAARFEIDSHMPVSYGDDVIISLWITPREGIDLKYVRIHPQGDLTSIYVDSEKVGIDPAAQLAGPAEYIQGTSCRTEILSRQPGIPFVATCKLYARKTGWRKWFDWNVLIGAGRQQIEVEIVLQDGQSGAASYIAIAPDQLAHVLAGAAIAFRLDALIHEGLKLVGQGNVHRGHNAQAINFGKDWQTSIRIV